MMYPQNLHTNSTFCDGKDDPESTVKRALELGFTGIGFSEHSSMPYSPEYSMSKENTVRYKQTINELKERYHDQIDVFCGLEFDMYSDDDQKGYDYMIGSMHYLKRGHEYIGFDRPVPVVQGIINEHFGGDGLRLAEAYYEDLCRLPEYGNFDIVGHFDLIAKHKGLFDTESSRYRAAALEAVHTLARSIPVFEVNTGAISRGYRDAPYPAPFILKELKALGCGVTISSDCHDNRYLDCAFAEALELVRSCGFEEVWILTKDGFKAIPAK